MLPHTGRGLNPSDAYRQNDQGRGVGKHLDQLRRDALSLQINLNRVTEAKEQGGQNNVHRVVSAKNRNGHGDISPARRHAPDKHIQLVQ